MAYLLPNGTQVACTFAGPIPAADREKGALAREIIDLRPLGYQAVRYGATAPAQVSFAGSGWWIKEGGPEGPDGNYFNRSSVSVDTAGALHLKLQKDVSGR